MAIDAQRDRGSGFGCSVRVAVDVVDFQRHLFHRSSRRSGAHRSRQHSAPGASQAGGQRGQLASGSPTPGGGALTGCLGWAPAHRRTDRRAPFPFHRPYRCCPWSIALFRRPSALRARTNQAHCCSAAVDPRLRPRQSADYMEDEVDLRSCQVVELVSSISPRAFRYAPVPPVIARTLSLVSKNRALDRDLPLWQKRGPAALPRLAHDHADTGSLDRCRPSAPSADGAHGIARRGRRRAPRAPWSRRPHRAWDPLGTPGRDRGGLGKSESRDGVAGDGGTTGPRRSQTDPRRVSGRSVRRALPDLLHSWRYGLDVAAACLLAAASVGAMRAPTIQSTGKKIPRPNSQ